MKNPFVNINWTLISADLMAALTTISLIPYDKDGMQLINDVFPHDWIPYVIKAGIGATLILRWLGRAHQTTIPAPPTTNAPTPPAVDVSKPQP